MSKIDCSKVLNYVSEMKRMCEAHGCNCFGIPNCPLANKACSQAKTITQEKIDILQKWSDEHPLETMAEHFFKMFPKAKLCLGMPDMCPEHLGWEEDLCENGKRTCLCEECWNRNYGISDLFAHLSTDSVLDV